MKTTRVLHVIGKMNRGGAESFIMELYRHIDRSLVQFDFLEIQYDNDDGAFDEEIRSLGGSIYRIELNRRVAPFSFYRKLRKFFSKHKELCIVHSHQYTMSGFIVCAAKKSGKITISHAHALRKKEKSVVKELYRQVGVELIKSYSDYFFGCSKEALYSLMDKQADGQKAFIIKNAIDAEKYYFSNVERICQRKSQGFTNERVIGCVGRFSEVKNQMFLIRIFAKAIRQEPSLALVFVGGGEKAKEVESYAREVGVEKNCRFLGIKSDVYNVINMFDAFCLPSLSEGLGIVYIEAQCNGLYCIAPLETVPEEADIGANSLKRLSINALESEWVNALLEITKLPRIDNAIIRDCIKTSGYDIKNSINWLQEFYLENSRYLNEYS